MQLNIQVTRINKKKTKWGIRITETTDLPYIRWFLPEFKHYSMAVEVAARMAQIYRLEGYEVVLDTKTCRGRNAAHTAALIYP
jgi:hypothetical protein